MDSGVAPSDMLSSFEWIPKFQCSLTIRIANVRRPGPAASPGDVAFKSVRRSFIIGLKDKI